MLNENAQDIINNCYDAGDNITYVINGSVRRQGKTYATKCLAERYLQ